MYRYSKLTPYKTIPAVRSYKRFIRIPCWIFLHHIGLIFLLFLDFKRCQINNYKLCTILGEMFASTVHSKLITSMGRKNVIVPCRNLPELYRYQKNNNHTVSGVVGVGETLKTIDELEEVGL